MEMSGNQELTEIWLNKPTGMLQLQLLYVLMQPVKKSNMGLYANKTDVSVTGGQHALFMQ